MPGEATRTGRSCGQKKFAESLVDNSGCFGEVELRDHQIAADLTEKCVTDSATTMSRDDDERSDPCRPGHRVATDAEDDIIPVLVRPEGAVTGSVLEGPSHFV